MRVLLVSPWHGGSHKAFAEGVARHSRHQVDLLTLPARAFAWRMRGAAARLAPEAAARERPDVVLASDMLDLAAFRGLAGMGPVPHVLYFHENQLTFPLPPGTQRDLSLGWINVQSALAADALVFNSRFHRDAFLDAVPGLLRALPDARPRGVPARLRGMSRVVPVGCDLLSLQRLARDRQREPGAPPVILWNHRWEHDKGPDRFADAVDALARREVPFRLALAGEEGARTHPAREHLLRVHGHRVIHRGPAAAGHGYASLLASADIAVTCARQENFGVSMVEAAALGAWPLAPRRLAYPEVLPAEYHRDCLYDSQEDLVDRLEALLGSPPPPARRAALAGAILVYDWSALIGTLDAALEAVPA